MALNCCQREAAFEYLVPVSDHFLKETEMDKELKVLRALPTHKQHKVTKVKMKA